jgi:hypothetical protein
MMAHNLGKEKYRTRSPVSTARFLIGLGITFDHFLLRPYYIRQRLPVEAPWGDRDFRVHSALEGGYGGVKILLSSIATKMQVRKTDTTGNGLYFS